MVLFLIACGFFSTILDDALTGFGTGLLTTTGVGLAVITAFSAASLI